MTPLCGLSGQCHIGDPRVKLKQETPQAPHCPSWQLPKQAEAMLSLDEPRQPLLLGQYEVCS